MPPFARTTLEIVMTPVDDTVLYLLAAAGAVVTLAASLYVAGVALAVICWCWSAGRAACRFALRLRSLAREAPAGEPPGLTSGG